LADAEVLDASAVALETLYLGLRTSDGAPAGMVDPATSDRWAAEGWAAVEGGRVRLTPEGWLRLDALAAAATRFPAIT
ncbi:MAG TPA: hypothetical protein VFT84_00995, partial [Gemmatimonadales bacterium]|nr:hypothetical protein [Gemmatimonadales bacterium]